MMGKKPSNPPAAGAAANSTMFSHSSVIVLPNND